MIYPSDLKFLTALTLAVAVVCALKPGVAKSQTKAEQKLIRAVVKKAEALGIDMCELNDGKKDWLQPNKNPIGDLPVYRCAAEDAFGGKTATYTQIPDGSVTKEAVQFCTFSDYHTQCEAVAADRPARRTADLAKFGVKQRQFEPIVCDNTSIGTLPMSMCSKPRAKPGPGLGRLDKMLGNK